MASRSGNWVLNVALIVVIAVAGVLVYAFTQRVSVPTPDPFRLENPNNLLGNIIQLEVLNGTQIAGAAAQMKNHLHELGFDVVETGNYSDQNVQQTVILDRVGNLDAAQQVAMAIGVPETRISEEIKPEYFIDATIIIGADYASVRPFVDLLEPSAASNADSEDSDENTEN